MIEKRQRIRTILPVNDDIKLEYIDNVDEEVLKRLSNRYDKNKLAKFVNNGADLAEVEKLTKNMVLIPYTN